MEYPSLDSVGVTLTQPLDYIKEKGFELMPHLIATFFVILLLWLALRISISLVNRNTTNQRKRYLWNKNLHYSAVIIGIILIANTWSNAFKSLTTFLGILSAGILVALKDPIVSIAGWLFIIFRKPFEVGERIQIGNNKGDVIDIRPFMFTILEVGNWIDAEQSTGRMINIPNGLVFSQTIANYDRGFEFIWNEIAVLLTFESDWKKAKKILEEIINDFSKEKEYDVEKQIKNASKKFLIVYHNLTPIVYTNVKDSGIELTIRYLCRSRKLTWFTTHYLGIDSGCF
ncbi:MAG: mechanosensitive ion channel [Candidatus Cloacimonetes bacterium]|nr:mechanosensitive ion channel [Candidatus Cloacimonadota bacterium]